MADQDTPSPSFKVYVHKFIQAVTKKHIVRLSDKSEDTPDAKAVITLSFATNGADKYTSMTLTVEEAKELSEAINKVLDEYEKEKK